MKISDYNGKKMVDAATLALDEWLHLLDSHKEEEYLFLINDTCPKGQSKDEDSLYFIDYMFPNDLIKKDYLATIHDRSNKEVIDLLRYFLFSSGRLGIDRARLDYILYCQKNDEETFERLMEREFSKRLLRSFISNDTVPWEGISWIIDLLPHHPKLAIDVLHSYLVAHFQVLPDGRIDGILDAMAVIREKFINACYDVSLLLSLTPEQFEHLVNALYMRMDYQTTLTQKTHDGGIDILAVKNDIGAKKVLSIQCKRTKKNVGVKNVRELFGVVSDKKFTKGVLITTAEFTIDASKFAEENPSIELIGQKDLQQLLSTFFGSQWTLNIDRIISQSLRAYSN